MEIIYEQQKDRSAFIPLLMLADESEAVVRSYLEDGEVYTFSNAGETVGIMLMVAVDSSTIEIKNMAVVDSARGQGTGRQMIKEMEKKLKNSGYRTILVGTSNSSIGNLIFYQKCGFRFESIKKDFFLVYPEPFYENGIRGLDMVMLKKELG
ncbi:GNAT family N-acetyltransferase [Rossellomorea sp. FS2]|uniref:GNAT family N-acetyltransferase n=1 Tax=Rossellomorea sp. FS2 TaxID=3391447 RepID=UPI003A4DE455